MAKLSIWDLMERIHGNIMKYTHRGDIRVWGTEKYVVVVIVLLATISCSVIEL